MTYDAIAKRIDHSLLGPTLGRRSSKTAADWQRRYGVASVCIKPYAVPLGRADLCRARESRWERPSGFRTAVTRRPSRSSRLEQAMADGATELDMVINIGQAMAATGMPCVRYRRGDQSRSRWRRDRQGYLRELLPERRTESRLCQICGEVGADYVKTSTGYGTGGATLDDLRLMRRAAPPHVKLKAAGGVRDLDR